MSAELEPEAKRIRFTSDKVIPIVVLFLTGLSILMVYSMRGEVVLQHIKHILFAYAGMILFYIVDHRTIGRFAPAILLFAAILLFFTFSSQVVRGISFFGKEVQTFYIIGFCLILYMSYSIGKKYKHKEKEYRQTISGGQDFKFELENRSAWGLYAVLCGFCLGIATLNMSTAIILFITGIAILYVGGARARTVLRMVEIVVAILVLVVLLVANMSDESKLKMGRMATFINRWEYYITNDNTDGYGDQMILARTAIARSGLHPAGPGKGVIKNRLPEKETDYAFASMFEETGLIVGLMIVFSYLIIFYRAWNIAKNAKGQYGRLLAFGIGFWFTTQAFIHIAVNCELIPATGQTLPFISSGGSSLAVSGCAIGILLNIAKVSNREDSKEKPIEILRD